MHIETVSAGSAFELTAPHTLLIMFAVKPENVLLFPCAHERYQKEDMLLDPAVDPARAKQELMTSAAGLGNAKTREEVRTWQFGTLEAREGGLKCVSGGSRSQA